MSTHNTSPIFRSTDLRVDSAWDLRDHDYYKPLLHRHLQEPAQRRFEHEQNDLQRRKDYLFVKDEKSREERVQKRQHQVELSKEEQALERQEQHQIVADQKERDQLRENLQQQRKQRELQTRSKQHEQQDADFAKQKTAQKEKREQEHKKEQEKRVQHQNNLRQLRSVLLTLQRATSKAVKSSAETRADGAAKLLPRDSEFKRHVQSHETKAANCEPLSYEAFLHKITNYMEPTVVFGVVIPTDDDSNNSQHSFILVCHDNQFWIFHSRAGKKSSSALSFLDFEHPITVAKVVKETHCGDKVTCFHAIPVSKIVQ